MGLIEGADEFKVTDLLEKLGEKFIELITDLPKSLKKEINEDIGEAIKQMKIEKEAAMIMRLLLKLDQAFMMMGHDNMTDMMMKGNMTDMMIGKGNRTEMMGGMYPSGEMMKNGTAEMMSPNLLKFLIALRMHGANVVRIVLTALINEDLHEFLVHNPLPMILRDPHDFFCGMNSRRLPMYFKHPRAPMILTELCEIEWDKLAAETDNFLYSGPEYKFDIFKAVEISDRLVMHVVIPQGTMIYDAVMPAVEAFLETYAFVTPPLDL